MAFKTQEEKDEAIEAQQAVVDKAVFDATPENSEVDKAKAKLAEIVAEEVE